MKIHRSLAWVLLVMFAAGAMPLVSPATRAIAADEHVHPAETTEKKGEQNDAEKKDDAKKDKPDEEQDKVVTTEHTATIDGKEIKYTATAGKLAMKSDDGKTKAHIFFIAYTKNGVEDLGKRPITFAFNGGPGSSSVWLHLGMLGAEAGEASRRCEAARAALRTGEQSAFAARHHRPGVHRPGEHGLLAAGRG